MSINIYLTIEVDTGGEEPYTVQLYADSITHNLTPMWDAAGCYGALYMRDGEKAGDIKGDLRMGLQNMQASPDVYKALNPSNGWGDYGGAVRFLTRLIAACEQHPKATVNVSK